MPLCSNGGVPGHGHTASILHRVYHNTHRVYHGVAGSRYFAPDIRNFEALVSAPGTKIRQNSCGLQLAQLSRAPRSAFGATVGLVFTVNGLGNLEAGATMILHRKIQKYRQNVRVCRYFPTPGL